VSDSAVAANSVPNAAEELEPMAQYPFELVDVFGDEAFSGNPLAVVNTPQELDAELMHSIARWLNLSETTFLLPPTDDSADYRVRIFTLERELPFAGHPTLGTCHVWLGAGGRAKAVGTVIQQCGLGLVRASRLRRPAAGSLGRGGLSDDRASRRGPRHIGGGDRRGALGR
jgi:predicted PhzF superfamily epimerase YddE/YHI9